jgi:hypothetical protein
VLSLTTRFRMDCGVLDPAAVSDTIDRVKTRYQALPNQLTPG